MKYNLELFGAYALIILLVTFPMMTANHISMIEIHGREKSCQPARRIDYIFPSRPLACWLSEVVK